MPIDNLVRQELPNFRYPYTWKVLRIRDPIRGLFLNDDVEYRNRTWRVFAIDGPGTTLVLRPEV